jgi:hypothetical protein
VPGAHQEIIGAAQAVTQDGALQKRPTFVLAMLDLLTALRNSCDSPDLHALLIAFLTRSREANAIPILSGVLFSPEEFRALAKLIGRPLEPELRAKLVPLIAESLGPFAATFLVLNGDDVSAKAETYKALDSVGDFLFSFAMQAFADMQVEDYALQSAVTVLVTRVITNAPQLIQEFILPTLHFHRRKRRRQISVSEAIIVITAITKRLPELLPSVVQICGLGSFKSIGTVDEGARTSALEVLGRDLEGGEWTNCPRSCCPSSVSSRRRRVSSPLSRRSAAWRRRPRSRVCSRGCHRRSTKETPSSSCSRSARRAPSPPTKSRRRCFT